MSGPASDFADLERRFTAHLRDPEGSPAPAGIEQRRLEVYRGLLLRNVEGFLSSYFPVFRRIVGEAEWQPLVAAYFAEHRAATPYFPKLAREFLSYLETRDDVIARWPFARELVYYEWLEAEVLIDPLELPEASIDRAGDPVTGIPVVNPVMRIEAFRWPVHRLGPDMLPEAPPETPTYLAVYRNRDERVRFMHLNPVSARLLALLIEDAGRSGGECLDMIVAELAHPDPAVVRRGGAEALAGLVEAEVLLGTLRQD